MFKRIPAWLVSALLLMLLTTISWAQTVSTDKADYYPGEVVQITGSGFHPNESVTLEVDENDGLGWTYGEPWTVQTDADGNFTGTWYVPVEALGRAFILTADCADGLHAYCFFTDSPRVKTVTVGAQSPNPVTAGNSANYPVTVTRDSANNAFTVTFSISSGSLPAGATLSWTPSPFTLANQAPSQAGTLTIATLASTPAGTYTFKVRGADMGNSGDFDDSDDVTLVVTGAPIRNYHATISPTSANSGSSFTPAITIHNDSTSNQLLGSANISVPASLAYSDGLYSATASGGKLWTAQMTGAGTTMQLRANTDAARLSPGEQVTVTLLSRTAPCPPSLTWSTSAREDRLFTGAAFTNTQPHPVLAITDNTPPTINSGNFNSFTNDADASCNAIVPDVRFMARSNSNDNCTAQGSLTVTQSPAAGSSVSGAGPHPITVTVTDAAGNSSTATVNFTVLDKIAPDLTVPSNITRDNDTGVCGAAVSFSTSATDNCDGSVSIVANPASGSTFPVGTTTVTVTATDDSGNVTTKTFTVTVNDVEKPTLVVPAVVKLFTEPGKCSAVATFAINASDNCPGVTFSASQNSGTSFPKGTTTVTVTATDAAGNVSEQKSFDVIVEDNEKPTITAPTNVTAQTDAGKCEASNVSLGSPTFDDNCPGSTVSNDAPTKFPKGTTTVTWTVTDASGNTATATQTVTVEDKEAPVPDIAQLPTVTEECNASVTAPKATDNCDGAITATTDDPTSYSAQGTYTITWKYTDAAGNVTTQTQTVVIDDVTAPVPNVAQLPDLTGECSVEVMTSPKATDNCVGMVTGMTTDPLSYTSQGEYTITWTYDDGNGNTSTQTQKVIVKDVTNPTIDAPANISQDNDPGACSAVVDSLGSATANDNCQVVSVVGVRSDNKPLTDPYPVGVTTITWTATDVGGNTASDTQTVTIKDAENPTISCPQNITVGNDPGQCGAVVTFATPSGSDNCPGVSVSQIGGPASGSEFPVGTTTVTFRATDAAGNTAECSFTVTVNDTEAPALTAPAAQSADEGATTSFQLGTLSDNCPGSGSFEVTVNWGDGSAPLVFMQSGQGAIDTKSHSYVDGPNTYTVTVTAKDSAGNIGSTSFTVTVANVAPVVTPASNQTAVEGTGKSFNLGSFIDAGVNDDPWSVEVNWGDGSTPETFNVGSAGTIATKTHAFADDGLYSVTVKVTDKDGGSHAATFTVNVSNVAPSVDAGGDQTVDEGATFSGTGSFTDPGADTWTATVNYGDGSGDQPLFLNPDKTFNLNHVYADNGAYTVTVTVTDDELASGSDTLTVTVNNVAPSVNAGGDQTVDEGATFSGSGSFTDPGDDSWTATVDYGDGSVVETLTLNGDKTLNLSHIYADNGTYTVTVTVKDDEGAIGADTLVVTVNNVDPTAEIAGAPASSPEGTAIALGSTITDPGSLDTHTLEWKVTKNGADFASGSGTSFTFTPDDNGSYVVTLTATDDDGGTDSDSKTVSVTNVDPTVNAGDDKTINEGQTFTGSGSFTDPSTVDTFTATVDFGDGSDEQALTLNANKTFNLSHAYADNGTFTVTVKVTDKDGGVGTDTLTVTVVNVPPALTAPADQTADEGTSKTFNLGSFSDAGVGDGPWSVKVNWGDSTPETTFNMASAGTITPKPHAYADNGVYEVTVTVADKDGGANSVKFNVTVSNVAPTTIITKPASGALIVFNNPIVMEGTFTDPGWLDGHTAEWTYQSATVGLTAFSGTVSEIGGNGTVTGSVVVPQPGVYSLTLKVTDKDGASTTANTVNGSTDLPAFVVVYDPTGSFVTGGGWINSPLGAYRPDPTLTGKANFGFVSKYKKGSNIPSGDTEFQFKAGDLNFKSVSYEWLVVAGSRAQFKGTGTINGQGDYGFILTAIDGQVAGGGGADKFRIKIWNKLTGAIVYDNQYGASDDAALTTVLGGGSIVIHK